MWLQYVYILFSPIFVYFAYLLYPIDLLIFIFVHHTALYSFRRSQNYSPILTTDMGTHAEYAVAQPNTGLFCYEPEIFSTLCSLPKLTDGIVGNFLPNPNVTPFCTTFLTPVSIYNIIFATPFSLLSYVGCYELPVWVLCIICS